MSDLFPLAIYPWPQAPDRMDAIRVAFESLHAPITVQPCEAVPGGPVRVLAIGDAPPWLCDSITVTRPDELAFALRWVLDGAQPLDLGNSVLSALQEIFGPETRELDPERVGPRFE